MQAFNLLVPPYFWTRYSRNSSYTSTYIHVSLRGMLGDGLLLRQPGQRKVRRDLSTSRQSLEIFPLPNSGFLHPKQNWECRILSRRILLILMCVWYGFPAQLKRMVSYGGSS